MGDRPAIIVDDYNTLHLQRVSSGQDGYYSCFADGYPVARFMVMVLPNSVIFTAGRMRCVSVRLRITLRKSNRVLFAYVRIEHSFFRWCSTDSLFKYRTSLASIARSLNLELYPIYSKVHFNSSGPFQ